MEPPTSIWTGAVYLEAAATHGMPDILWLKLALGEVRAGDELLDRLWQWSTLPTNEALAERALIAVSRPKTSEQMQI